MSYSSKSLKNFGKKEFDKLLKAKIIDYYARVLEKPAMSRAAEAKVPELKNLLINEYLSKSDKKKLKNEDEAGIKLFVEEMPKDKLDGIIAGILSKLTDVSVTGKMVIGKRGTPGTISFQH